MVACFCDGVSLMLRSIGEEGQECIEFWSDASGSWDCGAVWGGEWFQVSWKECTRFAAAPICAKELWDWGILLLPLLECLLKGVKLRQANIRRDLKSIHLPTTPEILWLLRSSWEAGRCNKIALFFGQRVALVSLVF